MSNFSQFPTCSKKQSIANGSRTSSISLALQFRSWSDYWRRHIVGVHCLLKKSWRTGRSWNVKQTMYAVDDEGKPRGCRKKKTGDTQGRSGNFRNTRVPQPSINVRIWTRQGCSNLEVLSTFGLISRYTAQHELETVRLLVVEIHMKVVITSFLLQPHSSLTLNSHASPSNSLSCCSQLTKKDYWIPDAIVQRYLKYGKVMILIL